MSKNLLPYRWNTERLRITDSILEEVEELQQINDAVPQTQSWMQVEGQENPDCSMLLVLKEGSLPPTPNRSKQFFRLQSIREEASGDLIGFIGLYHGFPEDEIIWINTLTFHPKFQAKGYGPELMKGLMENVRQLGCYTRIRSFVNLTNWPSLRLCVKAGLNKMIEIVGDKVHTDNAEAHVLVEKSLIET